MYALIAVVLAALVALFGFSFLAVEQVETGVSHVAAVEDCVPGLVDSYFSTQQRVIGYGMTRAEIEAAIGAPVAEDDPLKGFATYEWLRILYRDDTAVLLGFLGEAGNPWTTARGAGIGDSAERLTALYGLTDADKTGMNYTLYLTQDANGEFSRYEGTDGNWTYALSFFTDSTGVCYMSFGDKKAVMQYR